MTFQKKIAKPTGRLEGKLIKFVDETDACALQILSNVSCILVLFDDILQVYFDEKYFFLLEIGRCTFFKGLFCADSNSKTNSWYKNQPYAGILTQLEHRHRTLIMACLLRVQRSERL